MLDARPIHAYNGWTLAGSGKGGHIAGARTFPATWLAIEGIDDAITRLMFAAKGISHEAHIVVYGVDDADKNATVVAEAALRAADVKSARVLQGGVAAWAQELVKLPRYDLLVPDQWLREELAVRPSLILLYLVFF